MVKNPYMLLGIGLAATGSVLTPIFYFWVGSPALTSTGISAIILGFTCIAIANARPYLSPEAAQMLLKTGMQNTAALLEELGLRNKAIYLPSNENNQAKALIPLVGDNDIKLVKEKIPDRLIVRYGTNPEDVAIAVTTPGNVSLSLLENKPGPTEADIEATLNYLLTGVLDIARRVTVVVVGSNVEVKLSDSRMSYEDIWYYRCLGSPAASIAAAVVAEALGKGVRIKEETMQKGNCKITLEALV